MGGFRASGTEIADGGGESARRGRADAEVLLRDVRECLLDVLAAALVPVPVHGEPVAQVLGFAPRDESQQRGSDFQKAEVADEFILLLSGPELGQDRLHRGGRAGFFAVRRGFHLERTHGRGGHELERGFEHEPRGNLLHGVAQPLHLVEIEQERTEEHLRAVQRRRHLLPPALDVPIAEHREFDPGAPLRQITRRLLVQLDVEGFETGDEDDATPRRDRRRVGVATDDPLRRRLDRRGRGSLRGGFGGRRGASAASRDLQLSLDRGAFRGDSIALQFGPVRVSLESKPTRGVALLRRLQERVDGGGRLHAQSAERSLVEVGEGAGFRRRRVVRAGALGRHLDDEAREGVAVGGVEIGGEGRLAGGEARELILESGDRLLGGFGGDRGVHVDALALEFLSEELLRVGFRLGGLRPGGLAQRAEGRAAR